MKRHISKEHWEMDAPLTVITYGNLTFCLEHRTLEVCGQKIELTTKEFDIFSLLIMNPKRVFTYDMIMDRVWHEQYDFYSRKAINNHIFNIRKKLNSYPKVANHIKSVHSLGYKFEP